MAEYAILIFMIAFFLAIFYLTFTAAVDSYFSYLSGVWMAPVP